MRVLIVEEQKVPRLLMARMLQRHYGAAIVEAETDEEARAAMEESAFDLALVSAGPGGLELVRRLRASSRVPIIVMTKKSLPEDVLEAIEAGADDVLLKPVPIAALLEKVPRHVRPPSPPAA